MLTLCLACCLSIPTLLPCAAAADEEDLIAQLKDKDEKKRVDAAAQLGPKAAKSDKAFEALVGVLNDKDSIKLRELAIHAVGNSGRDSKTLLPHLKTALEEKKGDVAAIAIDALGDIGKKNKDAIPLLIDTLKNPTLGKRAASALGAIGPDIGKEGMTALGAALKVDATGAAAAHALGTMGKPALQLLKDGLAEKKADIRIYAVLGLELIGKDGVPDIAGTLEDSDGDVRLNAATALMRMGPKAAAGTKALAAVLDKDKDNEVRERACEALGAIGPEAKDALPALTRAAASMDKKEADVIKAATEAIKKIKKD